MDSEPSTPASNIVFPGTQPALVKRTQPSLLVAPQRTAGLQKRLLSDHIHSYSRAFPGGAFSSCSHSKQYLLSSMWAVMKGHTKCKLSILDQFCRANILWRPHNGRFHLIFTQGTFTHKRLISFIVWWIPNRPINLPSFKPKECLWKAEGGEAGQTAHALKNCPHIIQMKSRLRHHAKCWRMGNVCRSE